MEEKTIVILMYATAALFGLGWWCGCWLVTRKHSVIGSFIIANVSSLIVGATLFSFK